MRDLLNNPADDLTTKVKIFRAAARLFSEKGYNGVSMREISQATGLSKPTIYYYFGNKEGIYTTLVEEGLKYNDELLQQILGREIPVKQKLRDLIKWRFRQVLEYPEMAKFFTLLFISAEKLPFLERYVVEVEQRREIVVTLIREGIATGEFGSNIDPTLASAIIQGTVIHYIIRQLKSKDIVLDDPLAEAIVELVFKGLNE